jgi:small-conductance mechanosensitive channel
LGLHLRLHFSFIEFANITKERCLSFAEEMTRIFDFVDKLLHYRLFEIKQTPVTVFSILMFIIVVAAFYVFSKIFNRYILGRLLKRFNIESGLEYTILRVSHYLIMVISIGLAFQFVGVDLSGLAVIFGLLSVGIGFGLQNITSNFVAGIILLLERPIKIGDRITVGGIEGDVISISMRSTTVQSLNNISIIVPNSKFISDEVTNWSHGDPKIRLDLKVGVSYGSDLDKVLLTMREVADEHPDVLKDPPPEVLLSGFGDSSWNMILRAWIANPKRHYIVSSEINCSIVKKFRQNGIEIPFPQRDVYLKSIPPQLKVINDKG